MQGTVCFSAGLHAWAFSIPQWAATYAAKTSTPYEKWLDRLWGEHFLDTKTGKWQVRSRDSLLKQGVLHQPSRQIAHTRT